MLIASSPDELAVGSTLSGRYRVLRRLGHGGFGVVYAAQNLALGTEVAIKVGRRQGQERRILREARAAARLRSPFTVRVFDAATLDNGAVYIVMELLLGRSLRQRLNEEGPMAVPTAARWLLQVCSALREAHANKLVHRDIKPSNLFVVEGGGVETHMKLLDFGLAKVLEDQDASDATSTDGAAGSPLYMSPEQVRAADVTTQSDIWSLGVVFYEMLSGKVPYRGPSAGATLVSIVSEPPLSLEEARPGLPETVHAIVARCLKKDPGARYPDVESLTHALQLLDSALVVRGEPRDDATLTSTDAVYGDSTVGRREPNPKRARLVQVFWAAALLCVLALVVAVFLSLQQGGKGTSTQASSTPGEKPPEKSATLPAPVVSVSRPAAEVTPSSTPEPPPTARAARSREAAADPRHSASGAAAAPTPASSATGSTDRSRLVLEPQY